ncbi:ABC transporter ATP-binding protein [Rhabdochlamydiaceae symbiont of Dictyostelium giganteum]|uniref:ABC transporter ATP-binding protein n=1 Tax=Rhabdochlamydiaceae symbiont of Dictyostelium giganteum TaxID=3342349 RepID=UPI00384B7293
MKTILDIKNLEISVENKTQPWKVIRNVSFSLKEGEKLGIVGESGSGKTLLVRSIVKLLPQGVSITSGEIEYDGKILSSMSEKQLQKVRGKEIGMVFQDPLTFLNPTLKIGKQIIEGFKLHFPNASKAQANAKVLELLYQVGISQPELRLHQYPHELSGGLRQRVLIAIALAASPQLLIADEPTTALDVTVQAQILELLSQLQVRRSMILITHDLSIVASFCDRVIVMYAGEIVEDAPVHDLFFKPSHPYTEQLLKAIPTLTAQDKLVTIPGSPPDLSKPLVGCPFAPRCPYAFQKCHEKAPPLFSVGQKHRSLCWLKEPKG